MERYYATYIVSNSRAILSRLITFSIFNSYAQLIDHSMHLENSYLRQIKNILMSIPVMGTYIKQEIEIRKGTLILFHTIPMKELRLLSTYSLFFLFTSMALMKNPFLFLFHHHHHHQQHQICAYNNSYIFWVLRLFSSVQTFWQKSNS